jgi:ABC-type nitrate/sulfonate/bicarbonate transport system substrate-binding protein
MKTLLSSLTLLLIPLAMSIAGDKTVIRVGHFPNITPVQGLIAGAANGGAALVVQPNTNLKVPSDFKGKKIATPQLGNTLDISCRAWLASGAGSLTVF